MVLTINYTFKVIVGSCMVVRRVGAHATDYVCADSRRLIAGSLALQLFDDLLRGKGIPAVSGLDCRQDSEDLITSGHGMSLPPDDRPWIGLSSRGQASTWMGMAGTPCR